MYSYLTYFSLKVVPKRVLWGQSLYYEYMGPWGLTRSVRFPRPALATRDKGAQTHSRLNVGVGADGCRVSCSRFRGFVVKVGDVGDLELSSTAKLCGNGVESSVFRGSGGSAGRCSDKATALRATVDPTANTHCRTCSCLPSIQDDLSSCSGAGTYLPQMKVPNHPRVEASNPYTFLRPCNADWD